MLFSRLIASAIDRNIKITILVYVPAQQFKIMFFAFEIDWRMDVFEGKN